MLLVEVVKLSLDVNKVNTLCMSFDDEDGRCKLSLLRASSNSPLQP